MFLMKNGHFLSFLAIFRTTIGLVVYQDCLRFENKKTTPLFDFDLVSKYICRFFGKQFVASRRNNFQNDPNLKKSNFPKFSKKP